MKGARTPGQAMAKSLSKAAQDRQLFDEYKDMGAGMQDGGRGEVIISHVLGLGLCAHAQDTDTPLFSGQTMDFLEIFMILQKIELVSDSGRAGEGRALPACLSTNMTWITGSQVPDKGPSIRSISRFPRKQGRGRSRPCAGRHDPGRGGEEHQKEARARLRGLCAISEPPHHCSRLCAAARKGGAHPPRGNGARPPPMRRKLRVCLQGSCCSPHTSTGLSRVCALLLTQNHHESQ